MDPQTLNEKFARLRFLILEDYPVAEYGAGRVIPDYIRIKTNFYDSKEGGRFVYFYYNNKEIDSIYISKRTLAGPNIGEINCLLNDMSAVNIII